MDVAGRSLPFDRKNLQRLHGRWDLGLEHKHCARLIDGLTTIRASGAHGSVLLTYNGRKHCAA